MHYTEYKQSKIDERKCPVLYDTTKNSYRPGEFVLHRRLSPVTEGIHIAACSNKYILPGAEGRADNVG